MSSSGKQRARDAKPRIAQHHYNRGSEHNWESSEVAATRPDESVSRFTKCEKTGHDQQRSQSNEACNNRISSSKIPKCYESIKDGSQIPKEVVKFCEVLCQSIEDVFFVFAFTPAKSAGSSLTKRGNRLREPFCTSGFIVDRISRYQSKFASMVTMLQSQAESVSQIGGIIFQDRNSHLSVATRYSGKMREVQERIIELQASKASVEFRLRELSFSAVGKSSSTIGEVTTGSKSKKPIPAPRGSIDKSKRAKSQLAREDKQITNSLANAQKSLNTYLLARDSALEQASLGSSRSDCHLVMENVCRVEAMCIEKYIIWVGRLIQFLTLAFSKSTELASAYFRKDLATDDVNTPEQLANCFDEWIRQMMLQRTRVSQPDIPTCPSFMDILLEDPNLNRSPERLLKMTLYANSLKYFMARAGSKHFSIQERENYSYSPAHRALKEAIKSLGDAWSCNSTRFPEFLNNWRHNEALSSSTFALDRVPYFKLSPGLELEIVRPFNCPFNMISMLPQEFVELCKPSMVCDSWGELRDNPTGSSILLNLFDQNHTLSSVASLLSTRAAALNSEVSQIYPGHLGFELGEFRESSKTQKSVLTQALHETQVATMDRKTLHHHYQNYAHYHPSATQTNRLGSLDTNSLIANYGIHAPTCDLPLYRNAPKTKSTDGNQSAITNEGENEQSSEDETDYYKELLDYSCNDQDGDMDLQSSSPTGSTKCGRGSPSRKLVDPGIFGDIMSMLHSLASGQEELGVKVNAYLSMQKTVASVPHTVSNGAHNTSRRKLRPGAAANSFVGSSPVYDPTSPRGVIPPGHCDDTKYPAPSLDMHNLRASFIGTQQMPIGTSSTVSEISEQIWPEVACYLKANTPAKRFSKQPPGGGGDFAHNTNGEDDIAIAPPPKFPWQSSRLNLGVLRRLGH